MTSAQRARLVVALGVLNLVLATFALAVGLGAPRTAPNEVAGASPTPIVTPGPSTSPSGPTPSPATIPPGGSPGTSTPPPSTQPSASVGPSVTPLPSGQVAIGPRASSAGSPAAGSTNPPNTKPTQPPAPTPRVTPAPTPRITPAPTPRATPRPTPKPTPNPTPKPDKTKTIPPCPGAVDGPPGKNKGEGGTRPCGHGKDKPKGGVVIVLPLAMAAAAGPLRRRMGDSLRRRRSTR